MNRRHTLLSVLFCLALTSSCGYEPPESRNRGTDPIDKELGLTRDDYRDMYNKRPGAPQFGAKVEPPIPDIAEILAMPQPPKLGETKLVSIAVTDDVPLKDVLIELARLADVDIEVDAGITGGVSFRAKDRPFNEVIDRITNLAGLRYSMKNSVLRVERDTPYVQDYPVNFLNIDRSSGASFSVGNSSGNSSSGGSSSGSGSGSSSGSGSGSGSSSGASSSGATSGGSSSSGDSSSGGPSTGSSSNVESKSASDFWKQFEEGVKQILSYRPTKLSSASTVSEQPSAAPNVPNSAEGQGAAAAAAASAAAAAAESRQSSNFYILNRQASTLTVSATEKQHEMIRQFLRMVEANTSAQVLIEAKVLEVTLNDTYQSGINWTNFGNGKVSFTGDFSDVISANSGIAPPRLTVLQNDLFKSGIDLSLAVTLLDEFGTTRALSSPRLHAMNNQQAVLSFAQGLVYFQVQISTTEAVLGANGQVTTPSRLTVSSTQKSAPVGIVLTLQPSIDTKTNEVTLTIRPTLTRLIKYVNDPGFNVAKADAIAKLSASNASTDVINNLSAINSPIPQIETRELDSIVKVKSGQALVIGGLLEDAIDNSDGGIPVASEIPLFGNLFKSVKRSNSKKELVIFLRATIVGTASPLDKTDKLLYEKFGNDPRPIEYNP